TVPPLPRTPIAPDLPTIGREELGRQFVGKIRPFLDAYCISCHSGASPEAEFDLDAKDLNAMATRSGRLLKMTGRLSNRQMPPADADKQPTADERVGVVAWLKAFTAEEIRAHAGDPGTVPACRLSNAEYNYTIKDLTGVDI